MATAKQIAANRRNAQKAGRKPGSYSAKTLDRMKVAEAIRQRTLKVADLLFEKQLSLARGAEYLFRIDKEWIKTGNKKNGEENGFWRNKKPVMVTNPEEMRQYLEDEFCSGDVEDDHDPSAAYYFLSARDPMNQAIESMQDRGLGPVKQELAVIITPKPIYGGGSQPRLPAGQKKLPMKKTKVTIIENGVRTTEEIEEEES